MTLRTDPLPRGLQALTLWPEWLHAVVHYGKDIENRTWHPPTSMIGKRICLHAGKYIGGRQSLSGQKEVFDRFRRFIDEQDLDALSLHQRDIERSAILAVVRLAGVVGDSSDPWFFGPWGWVLRDLVVLPEPVRCPGAQGFWRLSPAQWEAVERGWRRVVSSNPGGAS